MYHSHCVDIHADGIAQSESIYYLWPNVLTTDNGSEFRNKLNAAMLKKLGIRHSFITPYHPQVQSHDVYFI